ncbi:MAG: rod shape-determining protein RodA [Bacteroidales bacterium]|nr:rod shape-determining protein RodA [Bacteroidales bacterium]
MKHRGGNIFLSIDWLTVFLYLLLVFLGWLNIYSAVYDESHSSILSMSQRYGKQLIWIGISFIIITLVMVIQARVYSIFAYIVYGIAILALFLVLFLGTKTNGARSWFEITSNFKFQPAEFAKFATALALSKFMSNFDFDISSFNSQCVNNLFKAILILAIPAGLILCQPDMGSVLVYTSLIFVFYREGLPGFWLWLIVLAVLIFVSTLIFSLNFVIGGLFILTFIGYTLYKQKIVSSLIGLGLYLFTFAIFFIINHWGLQDKYQLHYIMLASIMLVSFVLLGYSFVKRHNPLKYSLIILIGSLLLVFSVDFIFHNVMTAHQQTLINVFLGVENDPQGTEYNVNQSKIAIGSGGLTGKGFLDGTQTKFNFVPEQATDFIFCTVGEEWGFVGCTTIILLFLGLIIRIMYLAEQQRSAFSRIYGYCVASILFLHLAINVGMTIGMVPVIGIPLPFFSYGGSSLWSFTTLLFIFIRLDASRDEQL